MENIDIAPYVPPIQEEGEKPPQRAKKSPLRNKLRKAGLVMMIVTVMMSLVSTGFTMFAMTDIARFFASITFVCLILGFCILSVNALADNLLRGE